MDSQFRVQAGPADVGDVDRAHAVVEAQPVSGAKQRKQFDAERAGEVVLAFGPVQALPRLLGATRETSRPIRANQAAPSADTAYRLSSCLAINPRRSRASATAPPSRPARWS